MTHHEIPKSHSSEMKAVLHYLDQVKVLNLEEIGNIFADEDVFVQNTRPLSLGIPSRTKKEDLAYLQGLADQVQGRPMEITIYDIIDSPGKAWAHFLLHGEPVEGKPFDIETIYQFTFTGGAFCLKVKSLTEFVDSKAYAGMD